MHLPILPEGFVDLISGFFRGVSDGQWSGAPAAPVGALITFLLAIVTGAIGSFLGWLFTRNTERLKISSGFLNYKLQKLQDGLESIHKEEFEILKGLSFLHDVPKLEGPSDLFPHIETAWNKWQHIMPYCFHMEPSSTQALRDRYHKLLNEVGSAKMRATGLDSGVIGEFFDAILEAVRVEIKLTIDELRK